MLIFMSGIRLPVALLLGFSAFVSSCATTEHRTPSPEPVPVESAPPQIDYLAVQHDLGMDGPPENVGYREKGFDACRLASDLPEISDCRHARFILVRFQLSCRPTQEAAQEA